jgi:hypothetical protein
VGLLVTGSVGLLVTGSVGLLVTGSVGLLAAGSVVPLIARPVAGLTPARARTPCASMPSRRRSRPTSKSTKAKAGAGGKEGK